MPTRASAPRPIRPLLVVAPPGPDRGELFAALEARADFQVFYAGDVAAAARALEDRPVALLIAAPELPAAAVTDLLRARERLRPALPVLVVRDRQGEEPAAWERQGVGVLRRPLLDGALGRSVDVVLGLGNA